MFQFVSVLAWDKLLFWICALYRTTTTFYCSVSGSPPDVPMKRLPFGRKGKRCPIIHWLKNFRSAAGPGLCHGVAGCGYVFLLLHRLTGDVKFLHRSLQFARFVLSPDFKQYAKIPDSPFSLFEGWGGAVCFMADLLQPEKAAFPLLEVLEFWRKKSKTKSPCLVRSTAKQAHASLRLADSPWPGSSAHG